MVEESSTVSVQLNGSKQSGESGHYISNRLFVYDLAQFLTPCSRDILASSLEDRTPSRVMIVPSRSNNDERSLEPTRTGGFRRFPAEGGLPISASLGRRAPAFDGSWKPGDFEEI